MANTLSGKLAALSAIDGVNDAAIHSTTQSAKALLRYVGIIDQVQHVEAIDVPVLTGYTGVAEGERVLLIAQSDPSSNGVYQRDSGDLKKIAHTLENGNLVIDRASSNPQSTMFYVYDEASDAWNQMPLTDGAMAL